MKEFIATGQFDAVLSHNRFTLVDRSAGPLMDDACQRGVAFVNGAPYGGGMLAENPTSSPSTPTGRPGKPSRARSARCSGPARSMASAGRRGVAVLAPRPGVRLHGVGVSEPSRIAEITALMSEQIPAGLWAELDSLSVAPELWLN